MNFYVRNLQTQAKEKIQKALRLLTGVDCWCEPIRLTGLALGFVLGFVIVFNVVTVPKVGVKFDHARAATMLVESSDSWGSGVVVERSNATGRQVFLWTAAHVVDTDPFAVKAKILFKHGDRRLGEGVFPAIPIAFSKAQDLALYWVQVPDDMVEDIKFATCEAQPIGAPIYHVGNFLGINFPGSVTVGIISETGRRPERIDGWFWPLTDQADLAVLPGGSGGGVFNQAGEVIGIMVAGVGPAAGFIPNRTIRAWAETNGVSWAFNDGSVCPSDENLLMFAEVLHKELELQKETELLLQILP